MSISNKTFENYSIDLSGKFESDEADYHISNKIESLSNLLDLSDSTDSNDSERNKDIYDRDSRRDENEGNDYRNQLDLSESTDSDDSEMNKDIYDRDSRRDENEKKDYRNQTNLSDSTDSDDSKTNEDIYDRDSRRDENEENDYRNQLDLSDSTDRREKNKETGIETGKSSDKSKTTGNRQKYAHLIKRYCPKCKTLAMVVAVYKIQPCTECDTPLDFLCDRCDKQYTSYKSLISHLDRKCNSQNLDLKCPVCEYRTHARTLMNRHLFLCLSGINFSCGLCKFTTKARQNLFRHMYSMHKDIFKVDCSQCKTKVNKCVRCRNMVPFCEACHTSFSSTDRFQKHQKSCKQSVLECKFCAYQTIDNIKLRKHIKLKHLSAPIP